MTAGTLIEKLKRLDRIHGNHRPRRWVPLAEVLAIVRAHESEVVIENDRVCIAGKWFVPALGTGDPVKAEQHKASPTFEQWAKSEGYDIERLDEEDCEAGRIYQYRDTQAAWDAWQAAQPKASAELIERTARMIAPGFFGESAAAWEPEHATEMQARAWKLAEDIVAAIQACSIAELPIECAVTEREHSNLADLKTERLDRNITDREECRRAFEEWYSGDRPPEHGKNRYLRSDTQLAWQVWQAAWKARNTARNEGVGLPVQQEPKYSTNGHAIVNRASGEEIPADEPIMIFRARDRHAKDAIAYYASRVENTHHQSVVYGRWQDFGLFAERNPDRMKEPDTASLPIKQKEG